jgi:hypothetical protein
MTMEEWIKTLKAGDEVAVMLQHDPPVIRAVERVTPSGRILVRTFRALDTFNPDGRERSAVPSARFSRGALIVSRGISSPSPPYAPSSRRSTRR